MAESLLHKNLTASAIEAQDHIAFRYIDTQLTYGELERKTNQLARQLARNKVKKGDRVGIYLDRGLETAIAVYGIFKAGAAYVPIDPQSPVSRVANIVQSCDISCLVSSTQKLAGILELIEAVPTLEFITGCEQPDSSRQPKHSECQFVPWSEVFSNDDSGYSENGIKVDDLAYVMFTSGSTGIPKGIMHSHATGHAHARLSADMYAISRSDRIGSHAPLHFDISTMGYLTSPLVGATTIIIPEAHTRMPASMTKLVQEEQMTIWYSVPFALIQMLTQGALPQRDLGLLRWVLYGGDPFSPRQIRQLMDFWPAAKFANVYGPAETNQCTLYLIPSSLKGSEEAIPIGHAIEEANAIILDSEEQEIQNDDIGELLINAPTMMLGYWERPDLSAKCFYENPANQKMYYRTGDLVSSDVEGIMHYHGRMDRLVKVRGNRIELDEVEAAILAHGQVVEAAAYLMDRGSEREHIELAITVKTDSARDEDLMIQFVTQRLPRYAIPDNIIFLEGFPRTASGKIDRVAVQKTRAMALQDAP